MSFSTLRHLSIPLIKLIHSFALILSLYENIQMHKCSPIIFNKKLSELILQITSILKY